MTSKTETRAWPETKDAKKNPPAREQRVLGWIPELGGWYVCVYYGGKIAPWADQNNDAIDDPTCYPTLYIELPPRP